MCLSNTLEGKILQIWGSGYYVSWENYIMALESDLSLLLTCWVNLANSQTTPSPRFLSCRIGLMFNIVGFLGSFSEGTWHKIKCSSCHWYFSPYHHLTWSGTYASFCVVLHIYVFLYWVRSFPIYISWDGHNLCTDHIIFYCVCPDLPLVLGMFFAVEHDTAVNINKLMFDVLLTERNSGGESILWRSMNGHIHCVPKPSTGFRWSMPFGISTILAWNKSHLLLRRCQRVAWLQFSQPLSWGGSSWSVYVPMSFSWLR